MVKFYVSFAFVTENDKRVISKSDSFVEYVETTCNKPAGK